MRFQDSGLVNDKLVERAFNYAQAYTQSLGKELLMNYKNAVTQNYEIEFRLLDLDLKDKIITPEQYEKEKAVLERERARDLQAATPETIRNALERMFRNNALGIALEVQNHSDKATPAQIAAALLAQSARSPIDCKKIGKEFGEAIENMVANIVDVGVYPVERDEKTAAANDDTKRLLMAGLTNRFRKAAGNLEPANKVSLQPGKAEEAFQEIKPLWGVDKKLDSRLVSVFNQVATTQKSSYTLEVNEKGLPVLINNSTPPPPKTGPVKKPIFGDEGF